MDIPKHLYHYTSIETLALILSKRTFRLTSLDTVDDLDEVKTSDLGNLGRFCFVSCWTDTSEEVIPLWKMYTPDMRGVRIRLPQKPFKKYILKEGEHSYFKNCESYINPNKSFKQGEYEVVNFDDNLLIKVEYTDDERLLFPKVCFEANEKNSFGKRIELINIGRYKRKSWQFQSEWRYKIFISPWNLDKNIGFFDTFRIGSLPFKFYDLDLDENIIEDMEIMLGPKTTEAEKIIVDSLVNKYNPRANIIFSKLSIR